MSRLIQNQNKPSFETKSDNLLILGGTFGPKKRLPIVVGGGTQDSDANAKHWLLTAKFEENDSFPMSSVAWETQFNTKHLLVEERKIEDIESLLAEIKRDRLVLPDVLPIMSGEVNGQTLSVNVKELGVSIIVLFSTLLLCTYIFEVQIINPLVGIVSVVAGVTFVLMGYAESKGWKR